MVCFRVSFSGGVKQYARNQEFLWAMGNETLMDIVRQQFISRKPMGQVLHRKAMDYFRKYMIVAKLAVICFSSLSSHSCDLRASMPGYSDRTQRGLLWPDQE